MSETHHSATAILGSLEGPRLEYPHLRVHLLGWLRRSWQVFVRIRKHVKRRCTNKFDHGTSIHFFRISRHMSASTTSVARTSAESASAGLNGKCNKDAGTIVLKIKRVRLDGHKGANALQNLPDTSASQTIASGHSIRYARPCLMHKTIKAQTNILVTVTSDLHMSSALRHGKSSHMTSRANDPMSRSSSVTDRLVSLPVALIAPEQSLSPTVCRVSAFTGDYVRG